MSVQKHCIPASMEHIVTLAFFVLGTGPEPRSYSFGEKSVTHPGDSQVLTGKQALHTFSQEPR